MRKLATTLALTLVSSIVLAANPVPEDAMACTSYSSLKMMANAALNSDMRLAESLMNENKCIILRSDLEYSWLDRDYLPIADQRLTAGKIRVYTDATHYDMFVVVDTFDVK